MFTLRVIEDSSGEVVFEQSYDLTPPMLEPVETDGGYGEGEFGEGGYGDE